MKVVETINFGALNIVVSANAAIAGSSAEGSVAVVDTVVDAADADIFAYTAAAAAVVFVVYVFVRFFDTVPHGTFVPDAVEAAYGTGARP